MEMEALANFEPTELQIKLLEEAIQREKAIITESASFDSKPPKLYFFEDEMQARNKAAREMIALFNS